MHKNKAVRYAKRLNARYSKKLRKNNPIKAPQKFNGPRLSDSWRYFPANDRSEQKENISIFAFVSRLFVYVIMLLITVYVPPFKNVYAHVIEVGVLALMWLIAIIELGDFLDEDT